MLPNAQHVGRNRVVCNGDWRSWEEVSAWFPAVPAEKHTKESAKPGFEEDVWTANPWMAQWLAFGDGSSSSSCQKSEGKKPRPDHPYAHVIEVEDVMRVLEEKRLELGLVAAASDTPDYVILLRGGKDLFERTGRYYDTLRVECVTDAVEDFSRTPQFTVEFWYGFG